jgi:hypothetical protein
VLELWAVIRNCSKPLLGMRVVFWTDNRNPLKSNTWFWHVTTVLNLLKIWNNHPRTIGSLILIIFIHRIDSYEQNERTTKLCKYPYGSMWKCYRASWIGTQVCFARPLSVPTLNLSWVWSEPAPTSAPWTSQKTAESLSVHLWKSQVLSGFGDNLGPWFFDSDFFSNKGSKLRNSLILKHF